MLFSEKLDRLASTAELAAGQDAHALAAALGASSGFGTAIGSGGSAVTASYLAACRRSLGHGPTWVTTPAEFVLTGETAQGGPIWLLSGSGANGDILAAFDRARAMSSPDIHVLTSRADGPLAERALEAGAGLHIADCGPEKDGFLATHTLAAAITRLLAAADLAAGGVSESRPAARLTEALAAVLGAEARALLAGILAGATSDRVLLVLHDPRLAPAAIALETCAWEAALCPVQRVDFRNFAHGRHVWIGHRPQSVIVLALTSTETQSMWSEIDRALPEQVKRLELDGGGCGRFETAVSIFSALAAIEGVAAAVGIDPARPGVANFGRDLFDSTSLGEAVARLPPPVRAKRLAVHRYDAENAARDLPLAHQRVRARWADAAIKGLVLDYDGTLVSGPDRDASISEPLVNALKERLEDGLRIAIATGRGGSAGECLRSVLPQHRHAEVLMGYYNGALLRPLSVDIRDEPRPQSEEVAAARAWLIAQGVVAEGLIRDKGVQLTLPRPPSLDIFALRAELHAAGHTGLRLVESGPTVDICLSTTCKTAVVDALAEFGGFDEGCILRVGDSGGPLGNDHALLASEMGVSVGGLCGRPFQGWPMFGPRIIGPDAVLRLLLALRKREAGGFRIALDALDAVV